MLIQKLLWSCNDPSIGPLWDIALLLFFEFFLIFLLIFEIYFWIIPFPSPTSQMVSGRKPPRGTSNPGKRIYVKIPLKGWVPWASLPPPPKLALDVVRRHLIEQWACSLITWSMLFPCQVIQPHDGELRRQMKAHTPVNNTPSHPINLASL